METRIKEDVNNAGRSVFTTEKYVERWYGNEWKTLLWESNPHTMNSWPKEFGAKWMAQKAIDEHIGKQHKETKYHYTETKK